MTNETTASQPNSIGDDAQFQELLVEYWRTTSSDCKINLIAYLDSKLSAPAAQASATIQAAPDLTKDVIEAVQWVTGTPDVDGIPQPYAGAIVLLETFAEIGMTAKRDGKPTPNSLLCTKFANDLRLAATIQEPVMVADPAGAALSDEQAYAQSGYRHFMTFDKFKAFRADCAAATVKAVPSETLELALCESAHLFLKPDQPYIFRVKPDCPECKALAQSAAPLADNTGGGE